MANLTSKICLIGDFSVGKTSLVKRYVTNEFDETYLTTVGVKIDTKEIHEHNNKLIIWDIAGSAKLDTVKKSYLQGTAGYLLVYDMSRPTTFDVALELQQRICEHLGNIPFILIGNKSDLGDKTTSQQKLTALNQIDKSIIHLKTSALTGEGVEQAFTALSATIKNPINATKSTK